MQKRPEKSNLPQSQQNSEQSSNKTLEYQPKMQYQSEERKRQVDLQELSQDPTKYPPPGKYCFSLDEKNCNTDKKDSETVKTVKYPNGDIYTGYMRDHLRHGYGTYRTEEKVYTGTWQSNLKHGSFIVFNLTNGLAEEVKFDQDRPTQTTNINNVSKDSPDILIKGLVCKKLEELTEMINDPTVSLIQKRSFSELSNSYIFLIFHQYFNLCI